MRSRLVQRVGRLLLPLLFTGCQETTDPQGEAGREQSTDLLPTITPAIASKAGPPTHSRFVVKGAIGYVNWFVGPDASGNTLNASISVAASTFEDRAFLSYAIVQCDAEGSCTTPEFGEGTIPVSDVTVIRQGVNVTGLKVSTNTNTPDYSHAGAGGPISMEWQTTRGFRLRATGVQEQRPEGEGPRIKIHGTQIFYSAAATGTVIGFPIASSQNAYIEGDNSQSQIIEVSH